MKPSILLIRSDARRKYPYVQYIYDAILQYYDAAGKVVRIWSLAEGAKKNQLQDPSVALWVIELPRTGNLSQISWLRQWQTIGLHRLIKKMQPGHVFYVGSNLPVLKSRNKDLTLPEQWLFIPEISCFDPDKAQNKTARTQKADILKQAGQMHQVFVYADTAIDTIKKALEVISLSGKGATTDAGNQPAINAWVPYPILPLLEQHEPLTPMSYEAKDAFKEAVTDGNEYFLMDGSYADQKGVIQYLKAFSHFKKWQKSAMRLILLISTSLNEDAGFKEMFASYHFRKDVLLKTGESLSIAERYEYLGAAYALIEPSGREDHIGILLAAVAKGTLAAGVPTPPAKALIGDGLFPLPGTTEKEIGQIMIAGYKSEILRDRHIKAGLEMAANYKAQTLGDWLAKFKGEKIVK